MDIYICIDARLTNYESMIKIKVTTCTLLTAFVTLSSSFKEIIPYYQKMHHAHYKSQYDRIKDDDDVIRFLGRIPNLCFLMKDNELLPDS